MEDVLSHGNLNRYTSHLPLNTDSSRPAMGYQDDDHLLSGGSAIASGFLLLARRQYDTDPAIEWPHRLFSECGIDGGAVNSMAISPHGRYIASGHEYESITIWSLESNTLAYKIIDLEGGPNTNASLAWSPDSTMLISGSDGLAFIWKVIGDTCDIKTPSHTLLQRDPVQAIAISSDGMTVATCSSVVNLWHIDTGERFAAIKVRDQVQCAAFSPDSKRLAIAVSNSQPSIGLYEVRTGKLTVELRGHSGIVWTLSFSSNSKRIVTSSDDHTARVWDVVTGEQLVSIREHIGPVWCAKFSPDDKEILTGSYDSLVAVCDSSTGASRLLLRDRSPRAEVVAYTPSGDYIVAGCTNGTIKIWENSGGRFICEIRGHNDKVKNVDFTPDGKKIITSGDDGTVRVWDLIDILRIA